MILNEEQQAILDGKQGEMMSKVMKTLVMYGETFGAERMVPVTSEYGHSVISFGLGVMDPIMDLFDRLIESGTVCRQKISTDPRPMASNVPSNPVLDLVFKAFMYNRQKRMEGQLEKFGLINNDAYTCACYLPEIGNVPKRGDVLSWAESSAVVFANSVLGAKCNRNSGIIEIFGSVAGYVPEFGFLTDDGRKADWIVEIKTTKKPEAQILGSAIGMKVLEQVPYVVGLDKWIGTELNDDTIGYLKDFGAATASNGSVGLYHIDNLTPEAKEQGMKLCRDSVRTYVIDDAELQRVQDSYPCIWKNKDAKPKLCFMGCPHMTYQQLIDWTIKVEEGLKASGNKKVLVPTVFTTAPAIEEKFNKSEYAERLKATGIVLSHICPLMYMNNPLAKKMPVITSSNKLRTYTSARFYNDDKILSIITKEGK